jgi:hypothetical protein
MAEFKKMEARIKELSSAQPPDPTLGGSNLPSASADGDLSKYEPPKVSDRDLY